MSNPDAIAEIVERLERATAETDIRSIEDAIHARLPEPKVIVPPRYCSSIDAALTLVPEGWSWMIDTDRKLNAGSIRARTCSPERTRRGKGWPKVVHECFAPTPTIALCIAALRARQSP